MTIENISDHMAKTCDCGSVKFNLLRSGAIECAGCQQKQPKLFWSAEEMNLQELLSMTVASKNIHNEPVEVSPDFRVAVQEKCAERGVRIIVHPHGHGGATLDFWVKDNTLSAL